MKKQDNALFLAVRKGDLIGMKDALKNGADIEEKETYGDTALNIAAENGYFEIVTFLVESGANIENLGGAAKTPVMNAAFEGHSKIVIFLIEKGAKISNDLLYSVQMKVDILEENAESGMVTEEGARAWKEFLDYLIDERKRQDAVKK